MARSSVKTLNQAVSVIVGGLWDILGKTGCGRMV